MRRSFSVLLSDASSGDEKHVSTLPSSVHQRRCVGVVAGVDRMALRIAPVSGSPSGSVSLSPPTSADGPLFEAVLYIQPAGYLPDRWLVAGAVARGIGSGPSVGLRPVVDDHSPLIRRLPLGRDPSPKVATNKHARKGYLSIHGATRCTKLEIVCATRSSAHSGRSVLMGRCENAVSIRWCSET